MGQPCVAYDNILISWEKDIEHYIKIGAKGRREHAELLRKCAQENYNIKISAKDWVGLFKEFEKINFPVMTENFLKNIGSTS